MKKNNYSKQLVCIVCILILSINNCISQTNSTFPKRVLITNDDGIDDPKIKELAAAFSKITETWVIAPVNNRSSSTHYTSAFKTYTLNVEERDLGAGIQAFAVDGYPADCILLALKGIMKDNPPDLVISGINGGPNLGFDWIASGTIGAARIAAYWGVPALAISGMDDQIPGSMDAAVKWIMQLAQSKLVNELTTAQYLTISIPRIAPGEIKGVKVAERAGILLNFNFKENITDTTYGKATWYLLRPNPIQSETKESDVNLYNSGYIVVVPMLADEHDYQLINYLKKNMNSIPKWETGN